MNDPPQVQKHQISPLRQGRPEKHRPVHIKTFENFSVRINDTILSDRRWRGSRSRTLLKALIVCGGDNVSRETLMDLLWPETDGERALQNLKVALFRLRKTGCCDGEKPLPWITVKDGCCSLSVHLCTIDSLLFTKTLSRAIQNGDDAALYAGALDLYHGDFLKHDRSETWIIRHREMLREEFIRGVLAFSNLCLEGGEDERFVPFVWKAIKIDPLREELYACLMKYYLRSGYPARALQIFQRAEEALKDGLGIAPGEALCALVRQANGRRM